MNNTNIARELELIENKSETYSSLISLLEDEQKNAKFSNEEDILGMKIHLLRVLNFSNELTRIVDSGIFSDFKIDALRFNYLYDNMERKSEVFYKLVDIHGVGIYPKYAPERYKPLIEEIKKSIQLMHTENGLDTTYMDNSLKSNEMREIDLNDYSEETLLNYFLNDKLRIMFEYSKLQHSVPDSNSNTKKKTLKI